MAIHSRILADSSALAQKASRCAVSLSEQMFTVFGTAVVGFFSFPGFAVKPFICSHLFPFFVLSAQFISTVIMHGYFQGWQRRSAEVLALDAAGNQIRQSEGHDVDKNHREEGIDCGAAHGLPVGSVLEGRNEVKVPHQSLFLSDDDTEAPFFRFLEEHIQDGKLEFDGIFCNTDGLAVRVCEFLRSREIRIPEDVQIIGYDGIVDFATGRYICSTIVQPVAEIAETAVRFLLNGDNAPANISLPVYFAPGGTTRE